MTITNEAILKALSTVQEPDLGQDLVTLNMIKNLEIEGSHVSFTVMLTTPACPFRGKIEKDCKEAVMKVDGVKTITVKMDSDVPNDGRMRGLVKTPIRNAIAIGSGKGGVGKSTVAVNVAVALSKAGARVGLLDADIYGPNTPTMLGVESLPPPQGPRIIPAEVYGLKMVSMGLLVRRGEPLIWRGPMLNSVIRQFLGDVEWGELDYLIIDLPPGTGDAALSLAQALPLSGAVIVTLPQLVSLEDAGRGINMFKKLEVPILGVVENMSYLELPDGSKMDLFGSGGGEHLSKLTETAFLGGVPIDQQVRIGGDTGKPIVVTNPESNVAKALNEIAEKIAQKVSVAAFGGSKSVPINIVE
ncbi:MAG: Mrp/NBP35 family ATP-binding protein [Anaerolineales bacterium]|nr:Mrp/NBP35 family ATP-binding protein [Anaerolineales bacterium]